MKRQDVQLGVEYAATAPLAYGREPSERPRRVRFTDTRPGLWLRVIEMEYAEGVSVTTRGGPGWRTVATEIVHANSVEGRKARDELPPGQREAMLDKYGIDEAYERKSIGGKAEPAIRRVLDHRTPIPFGDRIKYVDDSIKGGLPGEVWRYDQVTEEWHWFTTLVQPADIHRTWEEVTQRAEAKRVEEATKDASAKVPELNQLLGTIGLDKLMRFERSGSSTSAVQARLVDSNGERTLADLVAWAESKGLIAKIEVTK